MNRLLPGLVGDLHKRCRSIQQMLESPTTYPELSGYVALIYAEAEQVRRGIQRLAEDPDLGTPEVASDHLRTYKQLAEQVYILEAFPLPAITRYGEKDRYFTRLVQKLASQVGYPLPPPVVTAFSSEYYRSYPAFNLVEVPTGEDAFLLGLADLGHELGHILYRTSMDAFLGDSLTRLAEHIHREQVRDRYRQAPGDYLLGFNQLLGYWMTYWAEEFACDLIATYLFGPAFAWQHIRLTAGWDQDLYWPGFGEAADHPADEARMRAIMAALTEMELTADAAEVREVWGNYLALRRATKPQDYDVCYPDELLQGLAANVRAGYEALGLRLFTQQGTESVGINIPRLLETAWGKVRTEPSSYADWEAERLDELRSMLS